METAVMPRNVAAVNRLLLRQSAKQKMQQVMLTIKKKFRKNAILKGMNLEEGATAKERNEQIGGHKV